MARVDDVLRLAETAGLRGAGEVTTVDGFREGGGGRGLHAVVADVAGEGVERVTLVRGVGSGAAFGFDEVGGLGGTPVVEGRAEVADVEGRGATDAVEGLGCVAEDVEGLVCAGEHVEARVTLTRGWVVVDALDTLVRGLLSAPTVAAFGFVTGVATRSVAGFALGAGGCGGLATDLRDGGGPETDGRGLTESFLSEVEALAVAAGVDDGFGVGTSSVTASGCACSGVESDDLDRVGTGIPSPSIDTGEIGATTSSSVFPVPTPVPTTASGFRLSLGDGVGELVSAFEL
ncbi:hypothetical protein HK101_000907 [Irineochytrium annulatum]|nr:hypothetical protein HK101_000907 [Irineochytrium annulatum]